MSLEIAKQRMKNSTGISYILMVSLTTQDLDKLIPLLKEKNIKTLDLSGNQLNTLPESICV